MNVDNTFRQNLISKRAASGLTAAELSRRAGLNVRAVTDIEEGKAISPKISTAFAIAYALSADPGEMLGLGPRLSLRAELAQFLARFDEESQGQLLVALQALPLAPAG